jgi:drug/metabolite transporter (DMT)-like permease
MGTLALLWGSSYLWIKLALGGLVPVQITLVRLVLGAAVLLAMVLVARRHLPRDRKVWLHLLVPGFFGNALPFTLFGVGEVTVDSGVAGVLNATTPLWALLLAMVIRTEHKPSRLRLVGLVLGFVGTLVIFAPWRATGLASWGALACLAAAASYAISYTYIAKFLSTRLPPVVVGASQLLVASGFTALALPVGGRVAVHLTPVVVVAVVVLGLLGTGVAFWLINRLIADEGATTAASVSYLIPIVSVLLGAIVLGESVSLRVVAGMVVVLIGVALSRGALPRLRRHRRAEPQSQEAASTDDSPALTPKT